MAAKVLKIVDVSYGGENGFQQAIELSSECLGNVKFIQEKKLITKFFEEISQDTGKYIFGAKETVDALEDGTVETLIVYEGLDVMRIVLKHPYTGEETILFLTNEQERKDEYFKDTKNNVDLETIENKLLTEWIVNNYSNYGATLHFVSNKSQEGAQFQMGFGGIGGFLRYKLDMAEYDDETVYDDDNFM